MFLGTKWTISCRLVIRLPRAIGKDKWYPASNKHGRTGTGDSGLASGSAKHTVDRNLHHLYIVYQPVFKAGFTHPNCCYSKCSLWFLSISMGKVSEQAFCQSTAQDTWGRMSPGGCLIILGLFRNGDDCLFFWGGGSFCDPLSKVAPCTHASFCPWVPLSLFVWF